jgi:serine/threonine protein kinase
MDKYEMNLMEFVEMRRKSGKQFTCEEVKDFILQILHTLSYLQIKGISLRDIKPQNILYHHGRYLLCDFDEAMVNY